MTREQARKFSYEHGNGDDSTVDEIYDSRGSCNRCVYYKQKKLNPMGMDTPPVPFCSSLNRVVTDNWYCADFKRK